MLVRLCFSDRDRLFPTVSEALVTEPRTVAPRFNLRSDTLADQMLEG